MSIFKFLVEPQLTVHCGAGKGKGKLNQPLFGELRWRHVHMRLLDHHGWDFSEEQYFKYRLSLRFFVNLKEKAQREGLNDSKISHLIPAPYFIAVLKKICVKVQGWGRQGFFSAVL